MTMLKRLWRFVSDVLWTVGAERLSMKFLLASLEKVKVFAPHIPLDNDPPGFITQNGIRVEVVYEDKQRLAELGDRADVGINLPKSIHDVN